LATFPAQPPLALVADDITGACDAGVHFLATGWSVEVLLHPEQPDTGADLLAISTNTRGLSATAARRVVQALAARLQAVGRQVFYKKMDSTLHGHPGVEIDALLGAGAGQFALVCPAFPEMGRRLTGGELFMGQERRPTGRHLWTRLREGAAGAVCGVGLELLRKARAERWLGLSTWVQADRTMLAFDAEEEADLVRVIELGQDSFGRALLCGSTGLARRLGEALRDDVNQNRPGAQPKAPARGPLLAVVGSRSTVTREQVRQLISECGARQREMDALETVESESLAGPEVWTVTLGSTCEERISAALGTLSGGAPRPLLFSGGDTAQCMCRLSGATAIRLGGEIETGFPYGVLRGGWFDGWPVATKAGGFGDERSLIRAVDFFR